MTNSQSLADSGVSIGAVKLSDIGDRVIAIKEVQFQESFQFGQDFCEITADVFEDYASGTIEEANVMLISFGVVVVRTLRQFMGVQDTPPLVAPPLVVRVYLEGQTQMIEDVKTTKK